MSEKNKKQLILGSNNCQVDIDKCLCVIKETNLKIDNIFIEYDKSILKYFGDGIICSKLKDKKHKFKSSKIFSSLIKIGVPINHAFKIVYDVMFILFQNIEDGIYEKKDLSTHDIRKIVADSILHCDLEGVSLTEIEQWGDKYVRRYGHDGQRTQVYYDNSDRLDWIDYEFIKGTLIDNIIEDLHIKGNIYENKIKSNQLNSISEEIIDFINNCNMYRINYDILKLFVKEMALQPPHPWFVTSETAQNIRQYDIEAIHKHYIRLKEKICNKDLSELHYTICEILHHASSSILAGYMEVLGCNDLDAFYNLEHITDLLNKRSYEDLLIENHIINDLSSDLKYIDYSIEKFHVLLKRIRKKLYNRTNLFEVTEKFAEDVLLVYEIALKLFENTDKEKLKNFLYSSWSSHTTDFKEQYIRRFFSVINGMNTKGFLTTIPNCFWFEKNKSDDKMKVLVVCLEERMKWNEFYEFIKKRGVKKYLDAILFITEYKEDLQKYEDLMLEINDEEFDVKIAFKEDLQNIYVSNNKLAEYTKMIERELYL